MISIAHRLPILLVLAFAVFAGAQTPQPRPAAAPPSAAPQQPNTSAPSEFEPQKQPALAHASEEAAEEKPFVLFGKWTIPGPVVEVLRWSNFLILFGFLIYLLRKPMREFLSARARAILEGIEGGRRARDEAVARLKEIEARLAGLEAEIASLRAAASTEAQADRDRLRQSAVVEAEKILAQAEQEIGTMGKAALADLKRHAAALAVQLAEQRIRDQMTAERADALMHDYANRLGAKKV